MVSKRCMGIACYEIVKDGTSRCEKHTITKSVEVYQDRKASGGRYNAKIYDSARWRRLARKAKVILSDGLCQDCLDDGVTNIADVTDHIVEIADGGNPYELSNLRNLCHMHHNIKSSKERRNRKSLN